MATKNKANITSDIVAEIRTGNSDTTAAGLRTILYEILDSYVNVKDGGLVYETPVGYNGLLTLTDAKSFVYKKWVEDYVTNSYVPYTGATQNTDLGTFSLNAKSFHIKGTGGNGHLGLKHQSANITANASESSIGANSSGNPVWKNDGNPIQNILTNANITQTVTNGVTDKAPSEDAVYDLFAALDIANLIRQEFTYTSGAQTFTLTQTASACYAVFVMGQELNQSQYTCTGTTLTILDTLGTNDKVNIIYSNATLGINPAYTKLESDNLLAQVDANALLYAMSF